MNQLPIQIQPHEQEGGHGFLLRALHRNGLSFSQASAWLGLRWQRSVRGRDHLPWGWATGVDVTWLRSRLPQSHKTTEGLEHRFLGIGWRGAHSLRIKAPQVCPQCIQEFGYCPSTWDLMAVTVCIHHRALLVDRCERCGQALAWNRPAVDICVCKRFMPKPAHQAPVDELVLDWTKWISAHVHAPTGTSCDQLLPGLPREVTPDGAYRIALALGMRAVPDENLKPTMWTHHVSPLGMHKVLSRGLQRLTSCLTSQDWSSVRRLVHEQTLERLETSGVTGADRSIARRIRRQIFGLEKRGDPTLRHRAKGQLELFVEGG